MKNLLIFLLSFLINFVGISQVSSLYSFSETTGTYTAIVGGTQLVTTTGGATTYDTDGNNIVLPVGSQFTFNNTTITSVNMTSDGALWLNPQNTTTGFSVTGPISSNSVATGVISAMGMDLRSTAIASQVYERRWRDDGTEVIFQWQNCARYSATTPFVLNERFSFQIRINKTTNVIRIVYGNMTTIVNNNTYQPMVGLRGSTNADYNNRRVTTAIPDATPNWGAPNGSTAGTSNAHTVRFVTTCVPTSGLIFIWTPQSCLGPTSPTITYTSPTSANFSWAAPASPPSSGYYWEIRTSGAGGSGATGLVTSGTTAAGVTTASTSSLSSYTTYTLYVSSNCGASTSAWVGSTASTSPPVNNDCSGAILVSVNSSSTCTLTTSGNSNAATQSQTGCAGNADDDVWFSFIATNTSHIVTITPGSMADVVFQVFNGSCGALTSLACVDLTAGSSVETTTLNSLVVGVTYFIRVHSYAATNGSKGTFTICITTPCTTPTTAGTLTANKYSTTVNDAVVFTTTGNSGSITKFEYSYDNFLTVAGTVNNPANPYTLILNVQQPTMWFRTTSVSGVCPAGVTTPISVTLQSAPEYLYGTEDGDYISNVTLSTINNNSTYDSPLGDSYQDFTSISTTLVKGTNYTIYVSSPATFLGYPSGYSAWIDFNNDGIFQTTENIMQQSYGTTMSQSFTVPTTASVGLVTMRVLSSWAETPSIDAYEALGYDWGEIEEYKINITSGLPVELYSFDGVNIGNNNYLFWVTSSEQNTSHFNLQKSRDGESWTTITTLSAAGNSNTQIDYDVVDYKVEPIINYYRLQQYDNDGVYETFGPIAINNMDLNSQKTIIKYINLNGQEIDPEKLGFMDVYIEVYSDGTIRKVIK